MTSDRDRLIELLEDTLHEWECDVQSKTLSEIAEHLIENGVIVPPEVKDRYVMDTAKTLFESWNDVTGAICKNTSWYYELESVIEDIVKLSFGAGVLYREQAEQALKERERD